MSQVQAESRLQSRRRRQALHVTRHPKFPARRRPLNDERPATPVKTVPAPSWPAGVVARPAAPKRQYVAPATLLRPTQTPAPAVQRPPLPSQTSAPSTPVETKPEVTQVAEAALAADLALPVEELDLTTRPYNGLKRDGIDTVGQLVGRTAESLLDIRYFGQKSVDEVKAKLAGMGLALKGETAP